MQSFDGAIVTSEESPFGILRNLADVYTPREESIISWTARVAGIISCLGGCWMFAVAWKRRRVNTFHRLMLVLSLHLLVFSFWNVYGTAAVPVDTPDTYGAYGNTATCTAQGFFTYISAFSVYLYYAFLSVYSWSVIVYGNFNPKKYSKIESYIHVVVHVFPIASALYLVFIDAFNSGGLTCFIASIPFGCGDESGIECTRGPQNITQVIWFTTGIPTLFTILFPTLVMLALVVQVCRMQRVMKARANSQSDDKNVVSETEREQRSSSMAKDVSMKSTRSLKASSMKSTRFSLNNASIDMSGSLKIRDDIPTNDSSIAQYNVRSSTTTQSNNKRISRMTPCIVLRQSALYLGAIYLIFFPAVAYNIMAVMGNDASFSATLVMSIFTNSMGFWIALVYWFFSFCGSPVETRIISMRNHPSLNRSKLSMSVRRKLAEMEAQEEDCEIGNNQQQQQDRRSSTRYSFNIFDGTNVAGASPFAAFLFEGDESDLADDEAGTKFWQDSQRVQG